MNAKQPENAAPIGWRERLLRPVLIGLCLILAAQSLATMAGWRSTRAELRTMLEGPASEDRNAAIQRVTYERTPHHAQLIVARALVHNALNPGEEPGAVADAAAKLPQARELALEVLQQQPNSWQASMFLGAATYLDWSLHSDRRLYTSAAEWERPLIKAMAEARGKLEPRRFLVTAYIETWAALSPEKKTFARGLLEDTFRDDPVAFDRLAASWFEIEGADALEVMPDRPEIWQVLQRTHATARDWDAFSEAHMRYLESLELELKSDLEEAESRLRLGDVPRGRARCLAIVLAAPHNARFAAIVNQALELYPPGLHGLRSTVALSEWLGWALELGAVGIEPLSGLALGRLADAIGELEPPVGAMTALIAGDAYQIARYEKLAESKRSKEWAPFLIAKARRLVDRGEPTGAHEALEQVHRSFRSSARYWLARRSVALANSDLVDLAVVEAELAKVHKREWDALEWRWRGRRAMLELYPDLPTSNAATLWLEVAKAPAEGAVASIYWDGALVDVRTVRGGESVNLPLQFEARPHLLELRALAGGEVYPGRVWVED